MKAFIIHGAYGNPQENWFPWLKKELENLDYEVFSPTFPTPDNQSLENWNKVFEEYLDQLDKNTIMIGHSLACPFILNILQNTNAKVKAIYLVAGFHTLLGHPIDEINKTFVQNGFDWEKIRSNCEKIHMFSGDNDPYIKKYISDELALNLTANYTVVSGGGHLNKTAGYLDFPELLEAIKND